jgi:hypothetical protein
MKEDVCISLHQEARAKANLLQNQIPTSLEAASRLYTKLNKGAQPPLGFDKWYVSPFPPTIYHPRDHLEAHWWVLV